MMYRLQEALEQPSSWSGLSIRTLTFESKRQSPHIYSLVLNEVQHSFLMNTFSLST